MNRKEWLQLSSFAMASLLLPDTLWAKNEREHISYLLAKVKSEPLSFVAGKTFPFDWPVSEIRANGAEVFLNWSEKLNNKQEIFLRLTSATDVREECTLELSLPKSKMIIGQLDKHFAHYMQPFELLLSATLMSKVLIEGIGIKMIKGTKPFWFFSPSSIPNDVPKEYLPHLMISTGSFNQHEWKIRLLSFASLSTFGWMEGCVLDGIMSMAETDKNAEMVLHKHLNKYFANNTLVYENLMNKRSFERIHTVESILPFAMLARVNPEHAMLQQAIDFCKNHANATGVIADEIGNNRRLKTEECYTISYPLAILSQKLKQPALEKLAIANLTARVNLLFNGNSIYQNSKELGEPEYENWARGVGWYLLGMAKSLAVLPHNQATQPLRIAFQKGAKAAISRQQTNGLWANFLHEPETGIDTSGSACIAAALAYGNSKRLLPKSGKLAAQKCVIGLQKYFTPDGFLKGTAQVNKGGEALQRKGFRVVSPYTLGFMGVLSNSLKVSSKNSKLPFS